ncbi:diguanylate cyclase domain-containing protein [Paludibacterium yongneupense]|uniref:diguanylate cyclase domain-containing protein n=1 Tax=Paludibacterium yongneupense TaxID=400061 RepID=UPI0003FE3206|nr:diguanylate cyclase [Paludibacterium yongneupense]
MTTNRTFVLLLEEDAADAEQIRSCLTGGGENAESFSVEWVSTLPQALERLAAGGIEIVLVDIALADGNGAQACQRVRLAAPEAAILALVDADDADSRRQALGYGADDYLVKGRSDAYWLPRSLHYLVDRQVARHALSHAESSYRAMSDASPLGVFVADAGGDCVYTNAAYQKISGLTFEQALGTNWSMGIHPEDRERVLAQWRAASMGQEPFQAEYRFLQQDKKVVWARVSSAPLLDGVFENGRVKTVEDITERKMAEAVLRSAEDALFAEKERVQVTLNSIGDGVLTTDIAGKVNYLNKAAERMTGWSWAEALGHPLADVFTIVDGATRQPGADPALRAICEDRTVSLAADCLLVRRDRSESAIEDSTAPIHNRHGEVIGAVIVFHDVSESRVLARKMTHLAQHDFLTGLPNRVLLKERLTQAIGLAQRHRKQVGLLFLDLDDFKRINDSLGHAIGDQLLQSASDRLLANVRATDTVCRLGGDEFVILLAEIENHSDAALIAGKLLAAFGLPHGVGEHELQISLSIGISIYPGDGKDEEGMLQSADSAMYQAKACGRNNYQFYTADVKNGADGSGHGRGFARRSPMDGPMGRDEGEVAGTLARPPFFPAPHRVDDKTTGVGSESP